MPPRVACRAPQAPKPNQEELDVPPMSRIRSEPLIMARITQMRPTRVTVHPAPEEEEAPELEEVDRTDADLLREAEQLEQQHRAVRMVRSHSTVALAWPP